MFTIFLVGGAIRDKIINLKVKEFDWLVINSDVISFINFGFKKVGKDFPVFLHPFNKEEYTLARKEKKIGKGYYDFKCDFSFYVSLNEDLFRRDLTFNTLVLNDIGCLIDLFNGKSDIKNKLFSHISFAFFEDPLRILRVFRFYVKFFDYDFKISKYTESYIRKIVLDGLIFNFTLERILKEIFLALSYKNAFLFFYLLYKFDILKIIFYDFYLLFFSVKKYIFNTYLNLILQLNNLFFNIFVYTNNWFIKFSLIFYKILCKFSIKYEDKCLYFYNKKTLLIINRYIKDFGLSKKQKFFLINLFKFRCVFFKSIFLNDYFLFLFFFKINLLKDKIKFINYLLINDIDSKFNNKIHTFYTKYLLLDLIQFIHFYKYYNNKYFDFNHVFYKRKIKKEFNKIIFYYNKYY